MQGAEIDGLVTNLVVNGIEVMPYVKAELDRQHPARLLIRSNEPADLREAWRQLRGDWAVPTSSTPEKNVMEVNITSSPSWRRNRRAPQKPGTCWRCSATSVS
jgi:hypothetical protein